MERDLLVLTFGKKLLRRHLRKVEVRVSLNTHNLKSKTAESEILLFWLLTSILHPEYIHVVILIVFIIVFKPPDEVNSLSPAIVAHCTAFSTLRSA